jgi:hypothetical protein
MKKSFLAGCATLGLLVFLNASALAAPVLLGDFSDTTSYSYFNENPSSSIQFQGSYLLKDDFNRIVYPNITPDQVHGWGNPPMISLTWGPAFVGQTWTINQDNTAVDVFSLNREVLTNGINDYYAFMVPNSSGFISENSLYENGHHYYGSNNFDFAGCTIDSITLTLNDFTAATNTTTQGNINYTVRIYGLPTPIPGTLWLLGSGILGIVGIRSRSKKLS